MGPHFAVGSSSNLWTYRPIFFGFLGGPKSCSAASQVMDWSKMELVEMERAEGGTGVRRAQSGLKLDEHILTIY
jgi:hypothetical protein